MHNTNWTVISINLHKLGNGFYVVREINKNTCYAITNCEKINKQTNKYSQHRIHILSTACSGTTNVANT